MPSRAVKLSDARRFSSLEEYSEAGTDMEEEEEVIEVRRKTKRRRMALFFCCITLAVTAAVCIPLVYVFTPDRKEKDETTPTDRDEAVATQGCATTCGSHLKECIGEAMIEEGTMESYGICIISGGYHTRGRLVAFGACLAICKPCDALAEPVTDLDVLLCWVGCAATTADLNCTSPFEDTPSNHTRLVTPSPTHTTSTDAFYSSTSTTTSSEESTSTSSTTASSTTATTTTETTHSSSTSDTAGVSSASTLPAASATR